MKRTGVVLFLLMIGVFLVSQTALANPQLKPVLKMGQTGEIRGIVDYCGPNGSAGILIYIPGQSFMLKTGPSGMFVFNNVPAAKYNLVFEIPGQANWVKTDVVVSRRTITNLGTLAICPDNDGDGYNASTDCDDRNSAIYPGATELCDNIDNNCDGQVDEICQACNDSDADGYFGQAGCGTELDCNDGDAAINPGASEVCGDNLDNNCNEVLDEGCPMDADDDGYPVGEDCDDNDPAINPGAQELCDGIDNDCNGAIDDNLDPPPCELTEGVCNGASRTCLGVAGWSTCDYESQGFMPDEAGYACDGMDNDCDGQTDEDCVP